MRRKRELSENVGLVRFELTIDGSLRHASVLQRVIINDSSAGLRHRSQLETLMNSLTPPLACAIGVIIETLKSFSMFLSTSVDRSISADPLLIICIYEIDAKTAGARRHTGLGHNPAYEQENPADSISLQCGNIRVVFFKV